jgi:hypothetical protein
VLLDPSQYHRDMQRHTAEGGEETYSTFTLVVRRKAKENNFKAVRGQMNGARLARGVCLSAYVCLRSLSFSLWRGTGGADHGRLLGVGRCLRRFGT